MDREEAEQKFQREYHADLVSKTKPHLVHLHDFVWLEDSLDGRVELMMGDEVLTGFDFGGIRRDAELGEVPYAAVVRNNLDGGNSEIYDDPLSEYIGPAETFFRYFGPLRFDVVGVKNNPGGRKRSLVLLRVKPERSEPGNMRKEPLRFVKEGETLWTCHPSSIVYDSRREEDLEYYPKREIGVRRG